MTKLLLLRGNPRKSGFSQQMTDLFVKGAQECADVTDVDLTREDLHPCKGCFSCWTRTPGKCVQNDCMSKLFELFLSTDIIVLSSPLYAFSVSSYTKMFMERMLPLLAPGVIMNPNGLERNLLRFPDRAPKKMAGLIVGGLKSAEHATGVSATLKSFAEGFGIEYAGTLVRTESYILQFVDTKPKTMKTIDQAFYQAGHNLAKSGTISAELLQKASLQLAHDLNHFELYSNIYWNHAADVCKRGGDLDEARVLTNRDSRLLIHEMVNGIDKVATRGIKAVFQFEFSDTNEVFSIKINKGTGVLCEKAAPDPDLIISCEGATWAKIILRELDPMKALYGGELVLTGDKSLFRKLHLYFPPPKT
jgi:multimeric flavodoxin WrbA/putative sterol carrier protein